MARSPQWGSSALPGGQADLTPPAKVAKTRANIEALRTLRAGGRPAGPVAKGVLAGWLGWGALPEVFDEAWARDAGSEEVRDRPGDDLVAPTLSAQGLVLAGTLAPALCCGPVAASAAARSSSPITSCRGAMRQGTSTRPAAAASSRPRSATWPGRPGAGA